MVDVLRARRIGFRPLALLLSALVAAAVMGQTAFAADISGKWEGKWQECGHHGGPVCATVTKIDCNKYRVCFTGTCHYILPFHHDVIFCVVGQAGDRVLLEGKSVLGHITYRASASCVDFQAEYCCHNKKGRLCLSRCACSAPPVAPCAPLHHGAPPVHAMPLPHGF